MFSFYNASKIFIFVISCFLTVTGLMFFHINQSINQSNKTSIAPISSADRAQRRTNP